MSNDKTELANLIPIIEGFLKVELALALHPQKVFIKTFASGLDFLGWVNFPQARVLRKTTEKRIFKRIYEQPKEATLQSYLGLISHGNAFKLRQRILNWYGLWAEDNIL